MCSMVVYGFDFWELKVRVCYILNGAYVGSNDYSCEWGDWLGVCYERGFIMYVM